MTKAVPATAPPLAAPVPEHLAAPVWPADEEVLTLTPVALSSPGKALTGDTSNQES